MEDTIDIPTQISQAIRRVEPTAEVILFGSRVRGSARPDSDWDVLVLLNGSATLAREQAIFSSLSVVELTYGEIFSTLIYEKVYWQQTLKGSPLHRNVSQEGLLLPCLILRKRMSFPYLIRYIVLSLPLNKLSSSERKKFS